MSSAKYIFPLYTKVKKGRMVKYPFVIAHFDSDAHALAFAAYLNGKLGNKAHAGCNKQLLAVADTDVEWTIADGEPGDVFDYKVALGKSDNPDIYVSMSIPGVAPSANFDDILTANTGMESPGGVVLDTVIRQTATGQNVSNIAPNPVAPQPNP